MVCIYRCGPSLTQTGVTASVLRLEGKETKLRRGQKGWRSVRARLHRFRWQQYSKKGEACSFFWIYLWTDVQSVYVCIGGR
jgi:hypothetical protein